MLDRIIRFSLENRLLTLAFALALLVGALLRCVAYPSMCCPTWTAPA
ncbi:hypothetical protein [Hymenobacter radiodurans]|nr:hypothetical protein [Hymenobacter radiodurans]